MKPASRSRVRVILGATCYADAEAALQVAVQLAKQVGAEIHGYLVTDEAILSAAANPRARAIAYSGSGASGMSIEAMRSAFRADARLFARQLMHAARQASLRSMFREATGRLPLVMEKTGSAGDVLVFGYRRPIRDGDSLLLVLGDAPPGEELLDLSARLCAVLHKRLTVFAPAKARAELSVMLAGRGIHLPEFLPYEGGDALLARLERMSPSAVILATGGHDLPATARIVDAARCPVVVPLPRSSPEPDAPQEDSGAGA